MKTFFFATLLVTLVLVTLTIAKPPKKPAATSAVFFSNYCCIPTSKSSNFPLFLEKPSGAAKANAAVDIQSPEMKELISSFTKLIKSINKSVMTYTNATNAKLR